MLIIFCATENVIFTEELRNLLVCFHNIINLPNLGGDYVTYTELENSPELNLIVHFIGEAGQVTQLFPQNILRGMGYPLDIQVTLKPPLHSLGCPRILVGLMYSSLQEIEVDSRHYKQNTSHQPGQGFLHIHLFRGRDLPQEKHSTSETFSKCYLLPDPKKTTKCRTRPRKGKDPFWNEQFLVVGINYHEIKRRALEICIADNNTSIGKKAKFIGGVRLSLGYKAVVSAQTKQVNQVLRFLKSKGGVSGAMTHGEDETGEGRDAQRKVSFSDKDTVIGKVNVSTLKWKEASWARAASEGTNGKQSEEVNEEVETSNKTTENGAKEDGSCSTVSDDAKTNKIENEPQEMCSTSSTDELTTALPSSPDPSLNLKSGIGAGHETCEDYLETAVPGNAETQKSSPDTVQITNETSEGSWESGSTEMESKNDSLMQQRLFQSVLSSIKQLEFASWLRSDCDEEKESVWLSIKGKEGDQNQVNPSDNDNDFEETRGVLLAPYGCQQENENVDCTESNLRLSSRIAENGSEKEEKGTKIKTPATSSGIDLNVITKANDTQKAEKEDVRLPKLAEHSRGENDRRSDQQNGSKTVNKSESSSPEKTTRKDLPLKSASNKKLGPMETIQGNNAFESVSASQHEEINAEGLKSESTVSHTEARKASTSSNETKRSPSFTLRDFGKKLSLRRRSKPGDETAKGSETNLETGANKMMLDAQGLEITQWNLLVERPKQWHYCWHILRSEMNILH